MTRARILCRISSQHDGYHDQARRRRRAKATILIFRSERIQDPDESAFYIFYSQAAPFLSPGFIFLRIPSCLVEKRMGIWGYFSPAGRSWDFAVCGVKVGGS